MFDDQSLPAAILKNPAAVQSKVLTNFENLLNGTITVADPNNSFHEKALLCRAAENTCFVASVNCASPGSPTTSVIVKPDATVLTSQPYGLEGLLLADIDLSEATGLFALRYRALDL